MCLAEILDLHKRPKLGKIKSVEVFDLLLEKGLVIGWLFNVSIKNELFFFYAERIKLGSDKKNGRFR